MPGGQGWGLAPLCGGQTEDFSDKPKTGGWAVTSGLVEQHPGPVLCHEDMGTLGHQLFMSLLLLL